MTGAIALPVFFGLLFAVLAGFALHAVRRIRVGLRLRRAGLRTAGECTGVTWREDYVEASYGYELDGRAYKGTSGWMPGGSVEAGASVTVVYDPDAPHVSELGDCLSDSVRTSRMVVVALVPLLVVFGWLEVSGILALLQ
ncbi:DUF3592 domain-containing protein [Streptomyces sp. NPDC048442]|uniref:DUF3592 domain-containing protein n=1 Tax=Streptomyces sp. NPDC048442 TaxID=3154823 RepID=UPI0034128575